MDIRPPFLRVLGMVALVACPVGIIMSAAAEPFTRALFGTRWLPMIGPLTIMGLWAAVRQIDTTIGWLLNSLGRAGAVGWLSVLVLPPLIGGCILAAKLGGLTAVALVPLADTLLSAAVGSILAKRFVVLTYRAQWHAIRPAVHRLGTDLARHLGDRSSARARPAPRSRCRWPWLPACSYMRAVSRCSIPASCGKRWRKLTRMMRRAPSRDRSV